MEYRDFGRTGWSVSEIGYGMWGMAGWTGSDDQESLRSLQRAVDLGCNFFDTAWGYGEGKSEGLLGELVRQNPDRRLFTATKIPPQNFRWPSQCPPNSVASPLIRSSRNMRRTCSNNFAGWCSSLRAADFSNSSSGKLDHRK